MLNDRELTDEIGRLEGRLLDLKNKRGARRTARMKDAHAKLGLEGLPNGFPKDAGEWELYSSMPGSYLAGKRLTKRFVEVLKTFKEEVERSPAKAAKNAAKKMEKVMTKEAAFGATDSEPRYHMLQTILDFGRKLGHEMDACWID